MNFKKTIISSASVFTIGSLLMAPSVFADYNPSSYQNNSYGGYGSYNRNSNDYDMDNGYQNMGYNTMHPMSNRFSQPNFFNPVFTNSSSSSFVRLMEQLMISFLAQFQSSSQNQFSSSGLGFSPFTNVSFSGWGY